MQRTFRCAGADGTPREQFGIILWRYQVEYFRRRRHAEPRAIEQNPACEPQAFANVAMPIEVRVINQSFPTQA